MGVTPTKHCVLMCYSYIKIVTVSLLISCVCVFQWHALTREEQAKYYELARKERQLHMQLYPTWSARDNYVRTLLLTPPLSSSSSRLTGKKGKDTLTAFLR